MREVPSVASARQSTLREFLAVIFRRRWLILGLFLATTATIAVIAFNRKPVYQSTGRVLVKRGERESILEGSKRYLQWEEDLASEVQVIQSQAVLDRAQRILDQEAGGAASLRLAVKQIGAEVVGESNVIVIAYQDRNAVVARKAADALLRGYIEYRNETLTLAYPTEFFGSELKKVTAQLNRLMEERRQFASSQNLLNPAQQGSSLLGHRQALRQRLTEVESELAALRTTLDALKRAGDDPEGDLGVPLGAPTAAENAMTEIKRQIVQQQSRLAQLKERFLPESEEVRSAEQTIASLRGLLVVEVRSRIEGAGAEVAAAEARRRVVAQDLDEVEAKIDALPSQESRLTRLDQQISVLKESYEELSRRSDQARIAQATSSSITVLLLSPAGPATQVNTQDYVRLALAPAFSLIVGVGLAFFIDGLDTSVRTAGEAEQVLELPVLATLAERRRRRV